MKRAVLALAVSAVSTSQAVAGSLCSDDRATKAVKEIVQNAIPEWSVDLAHDFGDWAKIERVKNLTKIADVSSIRAIVRDNDTKLTTCIAKVTFALDDRTMSPEIRYTVQPLEDKPEQLHVDVSRPTAKPMRPRRDHRLRQLPPCQRSRYRPSITQQLSSTTARLRLLPLRSSSITLRQWLPLPNVPQLFRSSSHHRPRQIMTPSLVGISGLLETRYLPVAVMCSRTTN